ncbi:MAG: hypothetical protein Q8Q60_00250 [Candidatus Chromulinivorax sp.]|nr:hypothetical protein [Candidatus Chromulinivorax sp.]
MERFNSFSSDQIIITKRQLSMIMASMLLFCLFVFIVGFFLGKRTVIDDFSSKVTKESLHDQIDFLLTTQSLESSQENMATIEAEPEIETLSAIVIADTQQAPVSAIVTADRNTKDLQTQLVATASYTSRPENFPVLDNRSSITESVVDNKQPQYAQLIGFGTKQAAQAFVTRLKKHHVPVVLKTIISKTASGKQRTWYQAITPTYESAKELQDQVSKIKRLEHIRGNDIKIVYVK